MLLLLAMWAWSPALAVGQEEGTASSAEETIEFGALPGEGFDSFGLPGADASGAMGMQANEESDPPVTVSAEFTADADGTGRLFVTATIEPTWHIYSTTQGPGGPVKTTITVDSGSSYRVTGEFQADREPKSKAEEVFGGLVVESHYGEDGPVTWHAPIELTGGVDPSSVTIPGTVQAQPCDASTCMPPTKYPFEASFVSNAPIAVSEGATSGVGRETNAAAQSPTLELENLELDDEDYSIVYLILLGFVGGILLNFMPCVLPVVGLKVLSFIEQSGHDRRKAFLLNVWYSLGLLFVFWILASLMAFLEMGWGQQFGNQVVVITLTALVFTMGLSFLGVWEIPIPGFVGSGKAAEMTEKEGVAGAFLKGAFTTVLATPCTGPAMGFALAAVAGQPPLNIYAVFTSIGLGMASPYLIAGAFPKTVRFLPKPGAWMETFKQVMGFVLLGTVVFFLTTVSWPLVIPTVGFLFGLWAACWWIGRTPPTAETEVQLRSWLTAVAIGCVAWLVTFGPLKDAMERRFRGDVELLGVAIAEDEEGDEFELPWEPYSKARLEELVAANQTVLVDFTADWCANCKTLEAFVLNTEPVHNAVESGGVVTLTADWSDTNPDKAEVTELMEALGSKQVPSLAIFPAGKPHQPIRFRSGGYTRQQIVDALEAAGPSASRG